MYRHEFGEFVCGYYRAYRVNGILGGTLDLACILEFLCVLKVVLMADS